MTTIPPRMTRELAEHCMTKHSSDGTRSIQKGDLVDISAMDINDAIDRGDLPCVYRIPSAMFGPDIMPLDLDVVDDIERRATNWLIRHEIVKSEFGYLVAT